MKNYLSTVSSVSLLIALSAPLWLSQTAGAANPNNGAAAVKADNVSKARMLVRQVLSGDYAAVRGSFDANMKASLSKEGLQVAMESLYARAGSFQKFLGTKEVTILGFPVVYIGARFAAADCAYKVVFSRSGQVSGFFVEPGWPPALACPVTSTKPPAVALPKLCLEKSVTVGSGEWALPGTLTLPAQGKEPFPAVVLVHGSGPNDRDETLGPNKCFRDLAWGLASKGIAVLRYDKRTLVHGKKFSQITPPATVKEETIDDALAAVRLLKSDPSIDEHKIFVLGHSLGAMLAPRIAEGDHDIAGLIIMAGNTRPLEDLLVEQLDYISSVSGHLAPAEAARINGIKEQARAVKTLTASSDLPAARLPLGVSKEYWLSIQDYKPEKTAEALSCPMLIMQGGRDYQVTERDFDGWKRALSAKQGVTFKFYDKLNHIFVEGVGKATPAEYDKPGRVANYVVNDIADWVKH